MRVQIREIGDPVLNSNTASISSTVPFSLYLVGVPSACGCEGRYTASSLSSLSEEESSLKSFGFLACLSWCTFFFSFSLFA